MRVQILYFARLREAVGKDADQLHLPDAVTTPTLLADWLGTLGPGYAEAFADRTRLRCAVDQTMVALDAPFGSPQEIAFFPPVTGG
jgi:sulfur-carrier protein